MNTWPELTDDAFFSGAIKVLQPRKGYRSGIDAVLLAASLHVQNNKVFKILDLGAGVGVSGLSVAIRCPKVSITLVEKQRILSELAKRNISRNQFEDRMTVKQVDLLDVNAIDTLSGSNGREYFDHVISNPPFYDAHKIMKSKNTLKAESNSMLRGALKGWVEFMAEATKPGGSATVVHLAERLGEILQYFALHFGNINIQILYPRKHEKASRVLVRGIRGSRAPMHISPGIVLHSNDNAYCPQVERVLREPVEWPIWNKLN
ncbi:MAG: methyltransferase [Hyphomicrobiaceae bacterium]|nr:methyltransferase [Hyphomicrobiaceae bacterium]